MLQHLFISSFMGSFMQSLSHARTRTQCWAQQGKQMQPMAAILKTQETWIPASAPHPSSCTLPSGVWVRKQHSRTGPQRHAAGVRGVMGACCGVSPPPTHLDEEPHVLVAHTWMGPQELLSHLPQLPLGLLLMGLLQGLEHQGTGHQVEQDQSQQRQ